MNTICITGRITHDLELKATQSGISVCSFGVAVDRPGVKDKTDFLDVVAWRQSAEFVSKWFKKGDPIEVQGVLTSRTYEDRNGNKRKAVEIVADRIMFAKTKKRDDDDGYDERPYSEDEGSVESSGFSELEHDDGDLPF